MFAVEQAATTTGTWMLARMSGACLVPFVPRRKPDGKGYQLIVRCRQSVLRDWMMPKLPPRG
ncbi:hypothetical protein ACLB1N_06125 [Escherichia coli]